MEGSTGIALTIEKTIRMNINDSTLYIDYRIEGDLKEKLLLGVEFNFFIPWKWRRSIFRHGVGQDTFDFMNLQAIRKGPIL